MDDHSLQELLRETAEELGVVGAQLAIFDGREVRQFATGSRHLELKLPVTTDTLFQIGSTTKVFNAAMMMALVDNGKLALDAPVKSYVKNFRLAQPAAQDSVTLRHLLSMSAGLDNGPYHDHGRGDDALGRYVEVMAGIPHIFSPGTAFGYSNASTNVSGYVASRVMGCPWEDLLATFVLKPLGLKRSANFAEELLAHPVALGYRVDPKSNAVEPVPGWAMGRAMAPAGGTLSCCAGDLVHFARMFLNGGRSPDGATVLSPAAIATMHEPQITLPTSLMAQKWGVGPYWKQWGGYTIHGHSGTTLQGSSMLLWCPEKNIAIAATVNVAAQGYPLANRIFDAVFKPMFGIDKPLTPDPKSVVPADFEIDLYTGRFEDFGNTIHFANEDGKLVASIHSNGEIGGGPSMKTELIPLGNHRFLAANPAFSGNRMWDVAFWSEPGAGRPNYFLNGMFPLRRTG